MPNLFRHPIYRSPVHVYYASEVLKQVRHDRRFLKSRASAAIGVCSRFPLQVSAVPQAGACGLSVAIGFRLNGCAIKQKR